MQKKLEPESALPQPILSSYKDPSVELKDLVSYSLLILLERLNPKERAVYILKEGFSYTHQEIAEVLSITMESARKLLSRAASKIQGHQRQKKNTVTNEHLKKLEMFTDAIQERDLEGLHHLFHEDIEFRADGGKHIQVVANYVIGVEQVGPLMIEVFHRFQSALRREITTINHQPAILYYQEGHLRVCQIFELNQENQIVGINSVLDPEKLGFID